MVGGGVPADDGRPGGAAEPDRVGLLRLHELVPAAEELDLTDEVDRERELRQLRRIDWDEIVDAGADTVDDAGAAPGPGGAQDGEPLSEGQVRGMLEHRLGATPLEQAEQADAPDGPDGPDAPDAPDTPDDPDDPEGRAGPDPAPGEHD